MAKRTRSGFKKTKWTRLGTSGDIARFEKEGDRIEGVYRGFQMIKIEDRPVKSHRVELADGTVKQMSSTVLDNLEALPVGTDVRITFTEWRGKGRRRYKNFAIEYPEGTTVKDLGRRTKRK